MQNFSKIVRLGTTQIYGAAMSVFAEIKFRDGKLSICGVEGPRASGNAGGACGQIVIHMTPEYVANLKFAPGWDSDKVNRFIAVWNDWHLNDMRAGTPVQESFLKQRTSGPLEYYRWAKAVLADAGLDPDPDTGYSYGSAWLCQEVPADVLEWLQSLPATDKQPAWV